MYEDWGGREVRQLPDQAPEHLHRERRGREQTAVGPDQAQPLPACPTHSDVKWSDWFILSTTGCYHKICPTIFYVAYMNWSGNKEHVIPVTTTPNVLYCNPCIFSPTLLSPFLHNHLLLLSKLLINTVEITWQMRTRFTSSLQDGKRLLEKGEERSIWSMHSTFFINQKADIMYHVCTRFPVLKLFIYLFFCRAHYVYVFLKFSHCFCWTTYRIS